MHQAAQEAALGRSWASMVLPGGGGRSPLWFPCWNPLSGCSWFRRWSGTCCHWAVGSLSEKVLSVGATLKPTDSPVVGIITLWVANPKIKVFLPGPVASPSLWKAGWHERWPWGASSRPQWPPRRPPQGSRQRLEYSGLFPGDVRKAGLPGPLSPVSPVGGTAGYLGLLGGCGRPDEPVI